VDDDGGGEALMGVAAVRLGEVGFELEDEGRGEPVLLLHGFPTTRILWRGVAPALVQAGYRAIAPDLVGYGGSPCPAGVEPDMASQAGWLVGLLDALGIERATVVAHDVGTAAAQILVARAPERVRGLVLMDGVHAGEWAMEAAAWILTWQEPARLLRVLVRGIRTGSGSPARLPEETVREVLAPYEGEEGGAKLIRAARALHPRQVVEIMPVLRARRLPALVMWGAHDAYLPAETVGRPLAELLGAELVLLPGGHFVPLDCPREVAAGVLGFLATLPPARGGTT
jgi:pimeloyl-ACP methyl ester carboxylesterase